MSNDAQKQTLLNAVSLIRSAEQLLMQVSRASTDPVIIMKIVSEYNQLDSFLSQLLHAQAIADDADFASATAALKQQAATLQAEEDDIKTIVTDVGIAAQVVGYIAQALAFIATIA
jgi:hypothetical protein